MAAERAISTIEETNLTIDDGCDVPERTALMTRNVPAFPMETVALAATTGMEWNVGVTPTPIGRAVIPDTVVIPAN